MLATLLALIPSGVRTALMRAAVITMALAAAYAAGAWRAGRACEADALRADLAAARRDAETARLAGEYAALRFREQDQTDTDNRTVIAEIADARPTPDDRCRLGRADLDRLRAIR